MSMLLIKAWRALTTLFTASWFVVNRSTLVHYAVALQEGVELRWFFRGAGWRVVTNLLSMQAGREVRQENNLLFNIRPFLLLNILFAVSSSLASLSSP